MIPIWQQLERLVSDRTYAEVALRAYEYVKYSVYKREHGQLQPEIYCIAKATWSNCLYQLLTDLGMGEEEASQVCDDDDNLLELALRIQSVTGYGINSDID